MKRTHRHKMARLLLPAMLAVTAGDLQAANDRIAAEAGYAFAGEPFRLIVSGGPLADPGYGSGLIPQTRLQNDGSLAVDLVGTDLDEALSYLFSVPAAPLAAGDYPLRLRFRDRNAPEHTTPLATGTLAVVAPVVIDVPELVHAGESARVVFSALRSCSPFAGAALERFDQELRLYLPGRACTPGTQAFTQALDLPELEPGEYAVAVYDSFSRRSLARRSFKVIPTPLQMGPESRFELTVTRRDGQGVVEVARPVFGPEPGLQWQSSMLFYFFDRDNWELMVKVLDGCLINGRYWVFAAASTDVEYQIEVRDRITGSLQRYRHEAGSPAPAITDTGAFACTFP